jgi:Ca-activated chloride channel family protein
MRIRYSQWDQELLREANLRQLRKLFNNLLTAANGDADQALRWMEYLGKRHGFFDEDYGIGDFREDLEQRGDLREASDNEGTVRYQLTEKGERGIRQEAFEELFSTMRRDAMAGDHRTPHSGAGGEKLPETREWRFGDATDDIDFTRSIQNAVRTNGLDDLRFVEEDLEVNQREQATSCATVMMVDISHSMVLYGEDRITPAKKVSMALAEFIRTRFPKDVLEVGTFGDDAQMVTIRDLPYISVGPYHTNTKAALELAQRVLSTKRQANKQIFLITDGKASAIREDGRIYKNSFGLDPKVVNQTINEAVACRRKGIMITTFMITDDPYLKEFVDRLTKANKGRAFYAALDHLGSFVLNDYARNRRKRG